MMSERVFSFQPRWKEELVVTGSGGAFVLDLPMGVLSVHLPLETTWQEQAPEWARSLWSVLKEELEEWCLEHDADFYISASAGVYSF